MEITMIHAPQISSARCATSPSLFSGGGVKRRGEWASQGGSLPVVAAVCYAAEASNALAGTDAPFSTVVNLRLAGPPV